MQAQATSIQYQCTACSSPLARWSARCPSCSALGTVRTLTQDAQEALLRRFASDGEIARGIGKTPPPSTPETTSPVAAVAPSPPEIAPLPSRAEPVRITSVEEREHPRVSSGLSSLDRVLGGGIVPASVILFGGEPGIGKSTLLAQALARASKVVGRRVLYVTGEETIEQATMRARRVDAAHDDVWIVAESEVQTILSYVQRYEPAIVAIDSIQTVHDPDIGAAPGSLVQVRHCAGMIASFAKRTGTTTIIVGHVTKDGAIAGPKTLEHLVDVTLQLELGEHTDSRFRYLRAHKNRFGSTQEVGAFEMAERGMLDIEEQEAREQDRKAVDRGDSETARLRRALRAAIETWCPRDPGGDGADAETYRLVLDALGDRT